MGKGNLRIQTVAAEGAILVGQASITVTDENNHVLYELTTDNTGHAPEISLEAPDISLTEEPYTARRRYALYNVTARAEGYRTAVYKGVMIFDTSTSILTINLEPLASGETQDVITYNIGGHALDDRNPPETQEEASLPNSQAFTEVHSQEGRSVSAQLLWEVTIPNFITVHLGRPEVYATNVRVPFIDYIKNVASHEVYDTWPEQALIANIYCIVSLTLNRVYTVIC